MSIRDLRIYSYTGGSVLLKVNQCGKKVHRNKSMEEVVEAVKYLRKGRKRPMLSQLVIIEYTREGSKIVKIVDHGEIIQD